MKKDILLMVGPTIVPERVIKSMNTQVISHRTPEFSVIAKELNENLKKVFQTENEVMTLTGSGTSSMEAAIQNCFSIGDEVVIAVNGVFSERMAVMAETFGLKVKRAVYPMGQEADVESVMGFVTKETKGVFIVHNESSTGVFNNIEKFGEALKDTDILLIVDSVSGLGGLNLEVDNWHVDVAFTASQKALMGPPGLSFITLNDKAWKACKKADIPKFYFDLAQAKKMNAFAQHPWTPAVYSIMGMNEALKMILEEGLQNVFERHNKLSKMVINGMRELGINLYPKEERYASKTVNTFKFDKSPIFVNKIKEEYGVVISGGQDSLFNCTFRVGTMGYVTETDIATYLYAANKVLKKI